MIEILSIALRTLNYGNCGIIIIMGNARFTSSTVLIMSIEKRRHRTCATVFSLCAEPETQPPTKPSPIDLM